MDTSGDGGVPEVTEPVTDGHGTTVDLPMRMLHELESLQDILNIHTWCHVLDEDERAQLAQFLPPGTTDVHLQELLRQDSSTYFGSPVSRMWRAARAGLSHPRVVRYAQALDVLHRVAHVHSVREHHNKLVDRLCEARDADGAEADAKAAPEKPVVGEDAVPPGAAGRGTKRRRGATARRDS